MKLIKRLKQKFCKHEFETKRLAGFRSVNGWLVPLDISKCRKCGFIREDDHNG